MFKARFSCAGRRSSQLTSSTPSVCATTCSWRHRPPRPEAEMTQTPVRRQCGLDCATWIRGCSRCWSGSDTSTVSSTRSSTPSSTASSDERSSASFITGCDWWWCRLAAAAAENADDEAAVERHTLGLALRHAGGVVLPTCRQTDRQTDRPPIYLGYHYSTPQSIYTQLVSCVVKCRICSREVVASNLGLGYFAPRSTQPSIPPGSVPTIAGKAKAGMAHSDCVWTCGCAGKTDCEIPWEHVPYLSASAVMIHYEEALYQVYAPLHLPLPLYL